MKRILIVLGILFFPSLFWLLLTTGKNHFKHLEYFGQKIVTEKGDTLYHTIPSFSFINQEGKRITDKDLDGKIYVANFFFASCTNVCPKMNEQLQRVAEKFKDNDQIKFLSHTIDPESDSVPVLSDYAMKHNADNKQWWFLTGSKDSIYTLAREGYISIVGEASRDRNDIPHSQNLFLVDKEKHIRGIYDGLEPAEVDTLIDEISVLLQEYKEKKQ